MAADTRTRILSVAARLFEANGFEGTAVASILREADVNSGSLYHFFSSKEVLLVAVLEKYVETLDPGLLGAAERAADDPIEKIFALLDLYRGRLLVSGFTRGCPVGDLALEVGGRIPEAAAPILNYFTQLAARVEGWLEAAYPRSAAAERRALADFILSTLEGAILQARAVSAIAPFDHSVAQLRRLIGGPVIADAGDGGGRARPVTRRRASGAPRREEVAGIRPGPTEPPDVAEAEDPRSVAANEAAWWRAW